MEKVTIIMPSLNVAKYYKECIESAINQSLKEIEILCIDAGSTDGTEDIIKEYVQKDSRIKFIHSDIKSYGYQVNLGIDNSHGEYIAILETDDIVELEMYEKLYNLAEANNLDVIKADYDEFITLSNGEKMQTTKHLFDDKWDLYNQVVYPREHDRLFCEDYFLWKGIYSREFVIKSEIRLNETPGAAFQDIGFMQQMLSHANRVMYIDESFYRYRVDRDEASTYSPKILKYGWQEFNRLLEMYKKGNDLYLKGLYIHMMRSFRGELYSVLRATALDFESEYIEPYYDWFIEQIKGAEEKGIIDIDNDYFVALAPGTDKRASLFNKESQIKEISDMIKAEMDFANIIGGIVNQCCNTDIIIFGTGIRGKRYIRELDGRVQIKGLVDNDASKHNTNMCGFHIIDPKKSIELFKDCKYVIANKNNQEEIAEQLMGLGVDQGRIIADNLSFSGECR